jgi:predicted nucleotidyltransferase
MVEVTTPDPDLVARVQAALLTAPTVQLAVLFGSKAAGRSRPGSDLDIAIAVGPNGLDDARELALTRALTLGARAEVDLIRLERASTLLRWQIAITGIAVLEASPGAFARFRAEAASEYIDFAPALRRCSELFRQRLVEQLPGR